MNFYEKCLEKLREAIMTYFREQNDEFLRKIPVHLVSTTPAGQPLPYILIEARDFKKRRECVTLRVDVHCYSSPKHSFNGQEHGLLNHLSWRVTPLSEKHSMAMQMAKSETFVHPSGICETCAEYQIWIKA